MPHIVVKCYKGRSKEQLQRVAERVAQCAAEELEVRKEVVSVSIEEVDKDKWVDIYNNDIYGNKETLYIEPGYTMD